jgi:hypothetical protein
MSIVDALKYTELIEIESINKTVKDWCLHYKLSYSAVITKKHRSKLDYKEIIISYIK